MCLLDNFCYCFPLRLGAFVVAVIYLILSISGFLQYYGVYKSNSSDEITTANLVFAIINLLAALLLLIGVLLDNKWLVTPWVIIMALILFIYGVVISIFASKVYRQDTVSGYTELILMFLNILIPLYCLLVVCSYSVSI